MWAKISKLWLHTCITVSYQSAILCTFTRITQKVHIIHGCSTSTRTVLLSEMPLFWLELYVSYDWRVMAPNMHCSLFPICHLCVLTRITWKLPVIYGRSSCQTTALLSNTFLVWNRVAWEIWLKSYNPRHTLRLFSDISLSCLYCKPVHTLLFGAQLHMTAKLS